MSTHLRDICLGLVDLAFPESRPVVREDYRQAVDSVKTMDNDNKEQQTSPAEVGVWSRLSEVRSSL